MVLKVDSEKLVCQKCGRQFIPELPKYCSQCYSEKQGSLQQRICTQCGSIIDKDALAYCTTCFGSATSKYQQNVKEYHERTDELQSKLLIVEAQKEYVVELLRQRELQIKELEGTIGNLNKEIERLSTHLGILRRDRLQE